MSTKLLSLALLALPILSRAQVVPTAPGPGAVFKEGGACTVSWNADTTGQWKNTFIELMDGPNSPMHHLATVAQVDGTDPAKSPLTLTCPKVTVHSAIYFYQFTAAGQNTTWTTRFAISDANGGTTPPANAVQPNGGAAIPWGIGQLVDASEGSPPPPTAPAGQVDDSRASSGTSASSNSSSPILTAGTPSSTSTGTMSSPTLSSSSISTVFMSSALFGAPSTTSTPAAAANTTGSSSASGGGNSAIANGFSAVSTLAIAAVMGVIVFY